MNIQKTLIQTEKLLSDKKIKSARLDAEVILAFVLGKNREWLYANPEAQISPLKSRQFKQLILRRSKLEPVAYIIGKKEFYGLNFKVNKNVLIPRPETEILIETTLQEISKSYKLEPRTYFIADIGTGSGCISVTIAKKLSFASRRKQIKIFASDISQKALKIARLNAQKHQVAKKINFLKSDLFSNFPKNLKFNLILANLPYLSPHQITQDLKKEPKLALAGGKNGLKIYQRFFKQIKTHLGKNAVILIEIDPNQTNQLKKIIKKTLANYKIEIIRDLSHIDRIIKISS